MVGHFRKKGEEVVLHQAGCFGSQVQALISSVLSTWCFKLPILPGKSFLCSVV